MSDTPNWEKEFDKSYDIPKEILALYKANEADDFSWHNDICPSFGKEHGDEPVLIWVNHPAKKMRENTESKRFMVTNGCDNSVIETDDVSEAIKVYREELAKEISC